mmetsp:Transcript_6463/g.20726  ORF Transcript_6463/g.20726 Transcript_6463/m.20726 type:complete len:166 (+) Transcript_6463:1439-1936(+)
MSRWFVGSSNKSSAGAINRARAKATRMRHPPENSLVHFCCMALENPRPVRMPIARASAVAESSSSSRSYKKFKRSVRSSASSVLPSSAAASTVMSAIKSFNSSISFSVCAFSSSTFITANNAVSSVAGYSVVKWKISIDSGMGMARAPITRITVDLPDPFRPMKP